MFNIFCKYSQLNYFRYGEERGPLPVTLAANEDNEQKNHGKYHFIIPYALFQWTFNGIF